MVDPVNNRGYYEYRKVNTKAGTGMENGGKFSLEQGYTEKDSGKKRRKNQGRNGWCHCGIFQPVAGAVWRNRKQAESGKQ